MPDYQNANIMSGFVKTTQKVRWHPKNINLVENVRTS